MYEQLAKIYYKESKDAHIKAYEKRLNGYGSIKLPLKIKPLKSNQEFSCFYVNHHELMMTYEKILKNSRTIRKKMRGLPDKAITQYIYSKLMDELVMTNEIEGIQSTRVEMKIALEAKKSKQVRFSSFVNTYASILDYGLSSQIESVEKIREIYDTLVAQEMPEEDSLDGELFRKSAVNVTATTNKLLHKGIIPESAIKQQLSDVLKFLNEYEAPMLYKIAIAHYIFGYIHPFYDGNGRTVRYISSLYLRDELDILTSITLSYAINSYKKLYYDAFNSANNPLNKGELTMFCQAFFEILIHASDEIIQELSEKQEKLHLLYLAIEKQKETFSEEEFECLFIIGQVEIFGSENAGISRKELENELNLSTYKSKAIIEKLIQEGNVKTLKKSPVVVGLSDNLIDMTHVEV